MQKNAVALRAEKIVETLEVLSRRVTERFPSSGLAAVCARLAATSETTAERARAAGETNRPLRFAVALITLIVAALVLFIAWRIGPDFIDVLWNGQEGGRSGDVAQGFESVVNLLILAALAIYSILSLETRIVRRRVLADLHVLRSFAHVVDMHQLTKDPAAIVDPNARTPSSPVRDMSPFELARYLDYCSEMLALIGKLAALYAERTQDPQIISTANEIETLATGLSRKIWQKIVMIAPEHRA